MAGLTVILGQQLLSNGTDCFGWATLGVLALSAVGLSLSSVRVQIVARAVAWVAFVPALLAMMLELAHHRFEPALAGMAVASGAALFLARPALFTKHALEEFAPARFRGWFLSGSVAGVATAGVTALIALDSLSRPHGLTAGGLGALALSVALVSSAWGVVRMRAWGVLLGGLTAVVASVWGLAYGGVGGVALASCAVPGLLMGYPVLASRLSYGEVTGAVEGSLSSPRLRVALDEGATRVRTLEADEVTVERDEEDRDTPPRAGTILGA
jgi:hypothetical protein